MTLKRRYCEASPFTHFLAAVETNADLWRSLARRVEVPDAGGVTTLDEVIGILERRSASLRAA